MHDARPYALSIAGLDPSGGAGLLADVKTFEQFKVIGLGVCSAITAQHESRFDGVTWTSIDNITAQLEPLFDAYHIAVCKFGIVENVAVLNDLIDFLKSKNPDIKIVVDPVLQASVGYIFHGSPGEWNKALNRIYLLTPNTDEAIAIAGVDDALEAAKTLSEQCHVYLKGGHDPAFPGTDHLMLKDQSEELFHPQGNAPAKHGSGCILSAAITASLALGQTIGEACKTAKIYTEQALNSNAGLLSYHHV